MYQKLIEEILKEFRIPLGGLITSIVEDPCEIDDVLNKSSERRRNAMRATALIDESSFVPQMTASSGKTLKTQLPEATAKQIAALYLRTVAAMDKGASTTTDAQRNYDSRIKIMHEELGTEKASDIWYTLAKDAHRALVDDGATIGPDQCVQVELSLEPAHEETYDGRAPYVHMDTDTYAQNDSYGYAVSFCAQKIQPTESTDSSDILILDCGTVLYTGVPVITNQEIRLVVNKMRKNALFTPCTNVDAIVKRMAQDLNEATVNALKMYTDASLARMGIEQTRVKALNWVDTHSRTFHRSPMYSDMLWQTNNKPSDPWALAVWQWTKRMLGNRPTETSQMRFFSRLNLVAIDYRSYFEDDPRVVNKWFTVGDNTRVNVIIGLRKYLV